MFEFPTLIRGFQGKEGSGKRGTHPPGGGDQTNHRGRSVDKRVAPNPHCKLA